MLHLAVCGVGRSGSEIIRSLIDNERYSVDTVFCRDHSEKAGKDIGALLHMRDLGLTAVEISRIDETLKKFHVDAFIDFSNPVATKQLLIACKKHRIPGVICTTGFSEAEIQWMKEFVQSNHMGVVFAPNITLGINVLLACLKVLARALPSFDYQITEIHHNKKLDKPSGTAKRMASTLNSEFSESDHMKPDIPINSVRAGGCVGYHEVLAVSEYEMITLSHESFSRQAFAQGALVAIDFIIGKTGWYCMEDVIDVRSLIRDFSDGRAS